jgi:hypothetical protein
MQIEECFARYENLMHQKTANLPYRDPADLNAGKQIVQAVKESLGFRDEWIPDIRILAEETETGDGFDIRRLRAETWDGVFCPANLYVPHLASCNNKLPFIIICCGHGENGKLNSGYQLMASRLARQGSVVLVSDNIGQGERLAMGHGDCGGVFACGLTVQGLIVMETVGWLRWAKNLDFVDSSRIGAAGNSGGGTLTTFLAALYPELSAACPTGYPCSFDFIARKEKRHCDCNIIPRCLGKYEMWEVLSLFAPKPLLINQGIHDNLFPEDIFYSTARKVKEVYERIGAGGNFQAIAVTGTHSWDKARRIIIADFFHEVFGIEKSDENEVELKKRLLDVPEEAFECGLNTVQLAAKLSGKTPPEECKLEDVFKPRFEPDADSQNMFRTGTVRRIFAQFEAFMG